MQAQTPEVSGEKATTPAPELRLVSVYQLHKIHRELDACQKVIWLAGYRPQVPGGFDPAYVTGAQKQLKQIETLLAAPLRPFMFVQLHAGDVMDWTQDPNLAEVWEEDGLTVAKLYTSCGGAQ